MEEMRVWTFMLAMAAYGSSITVATSSGSMSISNLPFTLAIKRGRIGAIF